VNENDYGLLKMAAFHAQQIAREGYAAYSENLRYDYLEGKANMSITEGLGIRTPSRNGLRSSASVIAPAGSGPS
jgi:hypothetical protein